MQPDMQTLLAGARSFVKTAAVANPRSAKDMGLDMDSWGGLASDYLLSGTVGKNRAGRAKQLARSMGDDNIPLTVNHPATASMLYAAGGGLLGGAAGAGIGATTGDPDNTGMGAGLGVGVGALGGLLTAMYKRRQAMKEIAKDYEAGIPVDPNVKPNTGVLGGMFTPLGGPVRSGEADVYEASHGKYKGDQDKVTTSGPRTALNVATEIGARANPLLGSALMLGGGMGQSLNAARRVGNVDAAPAGKGSAAELRRQQRLQKAAADNGMLQQLLDGGRSLVSKVDLKNPMHTGAIGAGVGALGGLAGSALSNDEEEKSPLQAALLGGGLGGAAGAGVGMLNQHMSPHLPHIPQVGTPAQSRAATMA